MELWKISYEPYSGRCNVAICDRVKEYAREDIREPSERNTIEWICRPIEMYKLPRGLVLWA
jgi:hypothetical protein